MDDILLYVLAACCISAPIFGIIFLIFSKSKLEKMIGWILIILGTLSWRTITIFFYNFDPA